MRAESGRFFFMRTVELSDVLAVIEFGIGAVVTHEFAALFVLFEVAIDLRVDWACGTNELLGELN